MHTSDMSTVPWSETRGGNNINKCNMMLKLAHLPKITTLITLWASSGFMEWQSEFWSSHRQTDIQKVMHKSPGGPKNRLYYKNKE